jgi:amino acid permease
MQQSKWLPCLLLAAATAAILMVAGVSLASFLPFVVALACPLMMLVMMRGMAGMHQPPVDPGRRQPVARRSRRS